VVERRFFSLLRLIWLPSLLSVFVALLPLYYQFEAYGLTPDPKNFERIGNDPILNALQWFNMVASIALTAIIAISVHRMILLDDQQKGVYFYWRLTREEWLYMAAWIGYSLIVLIAAGLPLAGHFYWLFTHDWHGQLPHFPKVPSPEGGKAVFDFMQTLFADPRMWIVIFLSVLFGLVALARFGLVFPIIVAEGRLSFARSWVLTRGNFLRLVGFWIIVFVLTYVLILIMISILVVAVVAMLSGVLAGGKTVGALSILVFAVPASVSLVVYLVVGITIFIAGISFTYQALAGPVAPTETFE
jgi:hypothetical protein